MLCSDLNCVRFLTETRNILNEVSADLKKRDFSHEQKVALDCVPASDSVNITIDQYAVETFFRHLPQEGLWTRWHLWGLTEILQQRAGRNLVPHLPEDS